jgi:hypothetical protein
VSRMRGARPRRCCRASSIQVQSVARTQGSPSCLDGIQEQATGIEGKP